MSAPAPKADLLRVNLPGRPADGFAALAVRLCPTHTGYDALDQPPSLLLRDPREHGDEEVGHRPAGVEPEFVAQGAALRALAAVARWRA